MMRLYLLAHFSTKEGNAYQGSIETTNLRKGFGHVNNFYLNDTRYLGGSKSYKVEMLPLSHPHAILPRIAICPTQTDAYNSTRLEVLNLTHYL